MVAAADTPSKCAGVSLAPRAAAEAEIGCVAQRGAKNVHCRTRRGTREAAGDREPGAYSMWRQDSPTRHPGQRSGERRAPNARSSGGRAKRIGATAGEVLEVAHSGASRSSKVLREQVVDQRLVAQPSPLGLPPDGIEDLGIDPNGDQSSGLSTQGGPSHASHR